jgi:hypothetical protein
MNNSNKMGGKKVKEAPDVKEFNYFADILYTKIKLSKFTLDDKEEISLQSHIICITTK